MRVGLLLTLKKVMLSANEVLATTVGPLPNFNLSFISTECVYLYYMPLIIVLHKKKRDVERSRGIAILFSQICGRVE